MRIALTADHNGTTLAARLRAALEAGGHQVADHCAPADAGVVDYPPLCERVCRAVLTGTADRAVVVGGSGLGEVVACNKLPGIRAGLCPDTWHAGISRGNNDANVLVLGAKSIDPQLAEEVLAVWLATPFRGAEHARRLAMVEVLERGGTLLP